MSSRHLATALAFVSVAVGLLSAPLAGQRPSSASTPPKNWTALRTVDGQPDLQGYWTNDTFTPLERPSELGNKAVFSEAEAAAYFKQRLDQYVGQSKTDIHYDDAIWQGENVPKEPNLRTSLIVDPPDGRLPELTAQGAQMLAARVAARRSGPADDARSRSLAERCVSWGNVGPPMIPPTYNANLQILQSRDYVVIRHEMIHEDRIIPLDGRPHAPKGVALLAGDSRGRWDGETLVVDTTNFTDKTPFRGAPRNTRQDIFTSDALHVTERFTRVAPDRIRYQFTVDDAATWTKSWSGEVPIRKFDGPLFEYACHEGNYGLPNILMGARRLDRKGSAGTVR